MLEDALRGLGARLEQEPVPDVSAIVAAQLAERPPEPKPKRRRTLALALSGLLAVGGTAYAASDAVRDRARDWLDAVGIVTREGDHADQAPRASLSTAGLGTQLDPRAAARRADVPVPQAFGAPRAAFAAGRTVTFTWSPTSSLPESAVRGVGALLTVAPEGDPGDPFLLGKSLTGQTEARFLTLKGAEADTAVWIDGAPHAVKLFDGRRMTFRLAANVLVWRAGPHIYRLEGRFTQRAALTAARRTLR